MGKSLMKKLLFMCMLVIAMGVLPKHPVSAETTVTQKATKYTEIHNANEGMTRLKKNGKYGFMNSEGKMVTKCIYDKTGDFWDGVARVKKDGKYGFINTDGEEFIKCLYDEVNAFHNGKAKVKKDGRYILIDMTGKMVFDFGDCDPSLKEYEKTYEYDRDGEVVCVFDDNEYFFVDRKTGKRISEETYDELWSNTYELFNDVYTVTVDGQYGIVGSKGQVIVPCIYDGVGTFKDNVVRVNKDGKYGFFDKNGNQITDFVYDRTWTFTNGMARVEKDGKYGYINTKGKQVIACKYDSAGMFYEGLARVVKNGKYGYVNKKGKLVVKCTYEYVGNFHKGFAWVKQNGKYGYINKDGKQITECVYDTAWDFQYGFGHVEKDGKCGYINPEGKEVAECLYDREDVYEDCVIRYEIAGEYGKYGFISLDGTVVTKNIYDGGYGFGTHNGLLFLEKDGKYALYNLPEQKQLTKYAYSDIAYIYKNVAAVKKGSKYGIVGTEGQKLVGCTYDKISKFVNNRAIGEKGGKLYLLEIKED